MQSAQKKIMTSTIPSKYETIVIKNDVSKAFGTTTNRFPIHRELSAGPGNIMGLSVVVTNRIMKAVFAFLYYFRLLPE